MPLIPEAVIDDVLSRADIAELVGRYLPLRRAGRHFKALCPFHKEKTPSFMVNQEKQIFHCFGCGVGGNVFSFLMQHDRLTFPEAVRQLADHVGVRIPDHEASAGDGSRRELAALMEKVCAYFERMLASPQQGKAARAYLQGRGVSERTREAFRLGLAPAGWDRLIAAATTTGVSADQLEAAGLVIQGKSGPYDRFRSRLIFPIQDIRGKVVGFGGRSLDGQEPKYLNSPETALYTKGRHLFGLAQAKDAIAEAKTAVVVEGYFDCVVLSGGGISNVVSPLGTALTIDQARLLKRYAETALLAFDADAAGEQATLRGIDVLVETGMQVRVAPLPAGADPDECLRAYGRERFEQLLARSVKLFDFLVDAALRRYAVKGDVESNVRAAQFVLPTIARVPNAMLRSEYLRALADRLKLDERAVMDEFARTQPRSSAAAFPAVPRRGTPHPVTQGPERLLTALLLDDPTRVAQVRERLSLEEMTDGALRRILEVVYELSGAHRSSAPAQVISRLSEEGHGRLVTELVELAQSIASKPQALEECLRRIHANTRRRELAALQEQIRSAQRVGAEREVQRLLTSYQEQLKGG